MANRAFHRLDSNEELFHLPSPSQEFDIGSYPFGNQARGRNTDYDNDYAAYMSTHQQQQRPGFTSPFAATSAAYQPVGQSQDGEKRPQHQRTYTETSHRSRISSISSTTSKLISPLLTKSWHHGKDKHGDIGTVRVFSRSRQARKTFVHGFVQWIPPAVFAACMALVLFLYDEQQIISHGEKYTFNALLLGFTLLLGFSVQSSFKLYADLMRWRFLAGRHWDLKTFERIMGSSSQRTVLKLLWNGRKRGTWLPSRVQVVSFIYLFFAIGLQVVIACIGLCYSVETSQNSFAWAYGNTTISDLSLIQLVEPPDNLDALEFFVVQSGAANTYGLASTAFNTITDPLPADTNFGGTIYTNSNMSRYWYDFLSYCADPNCNVWQSTKRNVNASATCKQLTLQDNTGYLDRSNITYIDVDGSSTWWDFTNYAAGGTTTFAANMDETCGPRCSTIYALNTGSDFSDANKRELDYNPQFFICNNTVSEVAVNDPTVNQTQYSLPDLQARILAGSIGFAGSYTTNMSYQMKNYAYRTYWSWDFEEKTEDEMAQLVSKFSIGAIAAIDQSGPRISTYGQFPKRAIAVSVKWMWTIVILVAVPGTQLLFLFYVMWFTRGVVIRDGSFLGNARLLRPIADELGDKGCALSGEDIAEALDSVRIAYGVRLPAHEAMQTNYSHGQVNGSLMHLDIIQEGETTQSARMDGWRPGMHMPEGRYDGIETVDHSSSSQTSSCAKEMLMNRSVKKRRTRRMSL